MENASKALLMAAGVLISIMIASLLVLMFSTMSEYTRSYEETRETQKLQAFNSQFEKYLQYKEDENGNRVQVGVTAQDIVTVINLAKSYNEKNDYVAGNITVTVTVTGDTYTQDSDQEDLNNFLKNFSVNASHEVIKYKIKEIDGEMFGKASDGRINRIIFE